MDLFKTFNLEKTAALLLMLAVFFMVLWRFGANQCLAIAAILVILYRPWRQELFRLSWFKQPIILGALIFLVWALISLSYSETPSFAKALQGMTMYSKLLFLLVFPLALRHSRYRKWVENGLIYGVLINAIITTLYQHHNPWIIELFGPYFVLGKTFSINALQLVYAVVLALWLLYQRLAKREFNYLDIVVFVILLVFLWFINEERSGYLLFLALVLLALGQRFGKRAVLLGCIILPFLCWGVYTISPTVKTRVNTGIDNIVAYHQAQSSEDISTDNSLGVRLSFLKESYDIFKDHPILGTGIGSFRYVYVVYNPVQAQTVKINDPHNAYAYVAVELGAIGLLIYLSWLYLIWRFSGSLPVKDKNLLRGVWLMFVVMGFTDSGLALNAIGISFVVWLSLYLRSDSC